MYIRAGNKYKSRGGRLPLAVVSILPFVGHALGGQLAERKYKQADQKNAARDFTASPRSLPSFLFSTDPITVPRSSPSGAQFRRCSRRYYINNDPAGQIIGSNEKREGKGGEGKKRKVILSFLSRSAFPFTRLRKWTYFIFPTRIRRYTLSDHRISSTSTRSDFNFYSSRCYARGGNITVCIISKILAMTSGFFGSIGRRPFENAEIFAKKEKERDSKLHGLS